MAPGEGKAFRTEGARLAPGVCGCSCKRESSNFHYGLHTLGQRIERLKQTATRVRVFASLSQS